jgi:hypothetical protein
MNPLPQKISLAISDPETDQLLSSILSTISDGDELLPAVIPKMERWDPELDEPFFPSFTRKMTEVSRAIYEIPTINVGIVRQSCRERKKKREYVPPLY